MMYTNIKYIHITQSYSKTRKKMCVKPALSVNLTDTVGKGLTWKCSRGGNFCVFVLLHSSQKYPHSKINPYASLKEIGVV